MGSFMNEDRKLALRGLMSRNSHEILRLEKEAVSLEQQIEPLEREGYQRAACRQKQAANRIRRHIRALEKSNRSMSATLKGMTDRAREAAE